MLNLLKKKKKKSEDLCEILCKKGTIETPVTNTRRIDFLLDAFKISKDME